MLARGFDDRGQMLDIRLIFMKLSLGSVCVCSIILTSIRHSCVADRYRLLYDAYMHHVDDSWDQYGRIRGGEGEGLKSRWEGGEV